MILYLLDLSSSSPLGPRASWSPLHLSHEVMDVPLHLQFTLLRGSSWLCMQMQFNLLNFRRGSHALFQFSKLVLDILVCMVAVHSLSACEGIPV